MGKSLGRGHSSPLQKIFWFLAWKWRVLVHFGTIFSNWVSSWGARAPSAALWLRQWHMSDIILLATQSQSATHVRLVRISHGKVFEIRTWLQTLYCQDEYVEVEFKLWTKRWTVLYLWEARNNTTHIWMRRKHSKRTNTRKIQTDDWKRRPKDRRHEQCKSVCGNS